MEDEEDHKKKQKKGGEEEDKGNICSTFVRMLTTYFLYYPSQSVSACPVIFRQRSTILRPSQRSFYKGSRLAYNAMIHINRLLPSKRRRCCCRRRFVTFHYTKTKA